MAKSFKKLLSEVAQPKSAGERAFKDQHMIQRFDAQPSGQDHIFNGETPPKKRLADYMPGADSAAYDKASKIPDDGDGSIVDTTNGPVAVESVEEDDEGEDLTEEPGEEKPMMMGSLRAMAHNLQGIARYIASTNDPEEWFQNKLAGVAREMQTLYGYATAETMAMGEEVEQIDEISKAKVARYLKKVPASAADAGDKVGRSSANMAGASADVKKGYEKDRRKGIKTFLNRHRGTELAVAKLTGKAKRNATESMGEDVDHKVDGRRLNFKEKAKKLGYVKTEPEVEEDAFAAKAAHSKMAGKDKMKMGDKEYPVTMSKLNAAKIKSACEEVEIEEARAPKINKGTAKGSISAKGIRGKGMKKFDVNVSVVDGKFEFKITDESGRFQTVNMKKAASMLESVEDLQELDAQTQKKFVAGAKNMKAYANKDGGVDKKDFLAIAKSMETIARINILQAGQELARLNRMVDGLDTDVRERVYAELKKVGLVENLEEKKKEKPVKGKKLTVKQMRQALASPANRGTPKDKVSLKKAPWDESVNLEEKVTFKTGIITLDDGQKVKLSRDDATLLTKFFRDLNPRNSKEMRKVLVKDKSGWEEILGFAREAL